MFCLAALWSVPAAAEDPKISMNFRPESFNRTHNESFANSLQGTVVTGLGFFMDTDVTLPQLPVKSVSVLLPEGTDYDGIEITRLEETPWLNDVFVLPAQPVCIPEYIMPTVALPDADVYGFNGKYPESVVKHMDTAPIRGRRLAQFLIHPVRYIPAAGRLFVVTSLEFTVKTKLLEGSSTPVPMTPLFASIINESVSNPDPSLEAKAEKPAVGCLILTSRNLVEPFRRLAEYREINWNGGKIEVVDIADAIRNQEGADDAAKLRAYLRHRLLEDGIDYALLGGDDKIVPVRYFTYPGLEHNLDDLDNWPAEIYYSTLEADWPADSVANPIPLVPSVVVGRLPVREAVDVEGYLNKLISYEKGAFRDVRGKCLLTGVSAFFTYEGSNIKEVVNDGAAQFNSRGSGPVSDGELWARLMFRDTAMIHNPPREVRCLFDTVSSWDMEAPGSYGITAQRLVEKLNLGWEFLINNTHGYYDSFVISKNKDDYFTVKDAAALKNLTAVVAAVSCLCGGFDHGIDPSLSEALIRNPKGGSLVYYGCSRLGTANPADIYGGYSAQKIISFLNRVFRGKRPGKTLGEAFTAHKIEMAPLAIARSDQLNFYQIMQLAVHFEGDVTIPAAPPAVAQGSRIEASSSILFDTEAALTGKTKLTAVGIDAPSVRLPLKTLQGLSEDGDTQSGEPSRVAAFKWRKAFPLFDARATAANLKAGLSGPDALAREPYADFALALSGTLADKTRFKGAFAGEVRLGRPVIWSVRSRDSSLQAGALLEVQGFLFGDSRPKVYIEYRSGGAVEWKPCFVSEYRAYPNAEGISLSSFMDPATAESSLRFAYPELKEGETATGWMILVNKVGADAFPLVEEAAMNYYEGIQ